MFLLGCNLRQNGRGKFTSGKESFPAQGESVGRFARKVALKGPCWADFRCWIEFVLEAWVIVPCILLTAERCTENRQQIYHISYIYPLIEKSNRDLFISLAERKEHFPQEMDCFARSYSSKKLALAQPLMAKRILSCNGYDGSKPPKKDWLMPGCLLCGLSLVPTRAPSLQKA